MARTAQHAPDAPTWRQTRKIGGHVWHVSITWDGGDGRDGDRALCTWRRDTDPVQGFILRTTASRRDVTRHFQRLVLGFARR
ncbi:hypothetical protein [Ruegeria sp.]|uniref:hypothetical protein n=1 Tax=Ruegeria sp. TaxID=1879320 RepID=UPI003AFFEB7A